MIALAKYEELQKRLDRIKQFATDHNTKELADVVKEILRLLYTVNDTEV